MLEQELKEIWKNSSETERIKFDLSKLMIELNDKINRFERAFRRRDREELITAIISIPIFGYIAYLIPFPITKIGVVLAMIGFIWGIFERRNHRKQKAPVNLILSFQEQLKNQKNNIHREVKRYDTVLYWFLIPNFIPYTISIIGLGDPTEYGLSNTILNQLLPISFIYKIGSLVFAVVIFIAIFWAYKRVIRKQFKPLIEDIDKVMHQLEHEN
ncbi:hypothetical protein [Aquimarina macrocephali]|uniref:hypothetical protein n=1 Tax=Aquimarina macrocephali TaxID=666563 RepID=UPI000466A93C|nr:hypothetical protein [Aquimarina macrocephali]